MSHSGVPGASLLSSNPSYNPLGTFGTLLPDIGAAAGEIAAPGNPFSTAAFLTKGGFDLSQGSILPGLLQFASAAIPYALPNLGGGGGGGGGSDAASSAGAGTAAAAPAAGGFGSSLSDFLSSPSLAGAGNVASSAGADISSGASSAWDSIMNALGLGGGTGTAAAGQTLSSPGFADLASGPSLSLAGAAPSASSIIPAAGATLPTADISPSLVDQLTGGGTSATGAGATPELVGSPSITQGAPAPTGIPGFTAAHPYLTLGGGLLASQFLSPLLSKIAGTNNLTSQEKAMLNAEQPALNAANQLVGSEESGVLPPGAQQSVSDALQSDIASIKSRYAALGMSGSAAEQQDIANAQNQAAANSFSIAQEATQTGLTATGLNQQVYSTLVQDQLSRQQQLQNAFAGFFNALGVGTALSGAKAAARP